MKKILITGGAGFVGRYFTKYFLDQKYEVHVVDNIAQYTGGREPSNWPLFMPQDYKNFIFYQQDCRDWFISNLKDDFDYVLHLAAMVGLDFTAHCQKCESIERSSLTAIGFFSIIILPPTIAARCRT